MSHPLETRTPALLGLGHNFAEPVTVRDALAEAAMTGWNVRKGRAFAEDPETGELVEIPGEYGTIRTNPHSGSAEGLGTVGRVYTPIQNEQMAYFLTALVDESGAAVEAAGSINGGRDVFMALRLPEAMNLYTPTGQVDTTDLHLAVFGNHSGNGGVSVCVTTNRVACANARRVTLANAKTRYSVRHTTNALAALQEARDALGLVWRSLDRFQDEAEAMIETALAEDQMRRAVEELFKVAEAEGRTETRRQGHVDRVMELYTTSPTIVGTGIEHTRYAGLQALDEYIDHFWPRKGEAVGIAPLKRIDGDYANLKDRALRAFLVEA